MYLLSNLSPESQSAINYLSSGIRSRSLLTSVSIAYAIASHIPLPSTPVEDINEEYRFTNVIGVKQTLSQLNEMVILDTATILDYVERFYKLRYSVLYPTFEIYCNNPDTVIQDFLGAGSVLDPVALEAIKQGPIEVTKIYNSISKIILELKTSN